MPNPTYSMYAQNAVNGHPRYLVPQSVEIDLTNACNQDCVYCNVAEFRRTHLDVTRIHHYHKLIEQLATWTALGGAGGVQTVTFVGGGEPTARMGFEYVLEQAVDSNLLTALVTNGTSLNKLNNIPEPTLRRLAWVGVDVDSGDPEVYEAVRRSKSPHLYDKVKENIKWFSQINPRIDVKVLLHPLTISRKSLELTFAYAQEVNARMLYFRLALMEDGAIFRPTDEIFETIISLSKETGVLAKINKTRLLERTYCRCHALFMLPIFSADGEVYLCCENRGNKSFSLGSWIEGDFRSRWNSEAHKHIYETIDVSKCQPCRPHIHNVAVEESINTRTYFQELFL